MLLFNAVQQSTVKHVEGYFPHRVKLWGKHNIWAPREDNSQMPSKERLKDITDRSEGHIMCLDIEHLPYDIRKDSRKECEKTKDLIAAIIDEIRQYNPHVRIGIYMTMPVRSYWTPVYKSHKEYERRINSWKSANAFFRYHRDETGRYDSRSLCDAVDVIFPSLYTFYEDKVEDWKVYCEENLKEARRYQKPVYPFIWPQYHVPNKEDGKRHFIPGSFWKVQLDMIKNHADGLVLWSGSNFEWDENREWWIESKKFSNDVL